jgi:hypothetical protein
LAQRVGWGLMLLLVLAGLAGLFGRGPLAHGRAGAAGDPIRLEYERVTRHQSPSQLRVFVAPAALAGDTARVWVDRRYLAGVDVELIDPEPVESTVEPDRVVYAFLARADRGEAEISFRIRADKYWARPGAVGIAGGAASRQRLTFNQIVLP